MSVQSTPTIDRLPDGVPTQLLIDGRWVDGSSGTIDVFNPSTGEILAPVARAGLNDLDKALGAADGALPGWAATAPRERAEVLRRTFDLMIAHREELALVMSLEMGKSITDARGEVGYAAEFFRWFSEEAVRIDGDLRWAPSGANRILTFRRPVGVALLLTPWNFPAAMATRKIAPALAAGCSVVLKPPAETPFTALFVGRLLLEAGAPPGVVNMIPTDEPGPLVSAALADSRVRKMSFTGSTRSGSPCWSRRPSGSSTRRWSSVATTRSLFWMMRTSTLQSTAPCSPKCATVARPARRPTGSSSMRPWRPSLRRSWPQRCRR